MWPPEQIVEELDDLPCEVRLVPLSAEALADCDTLITVKHSKEVFNSPIKWVHTISAGVDQFPLSDYQEHNVILTNSSGIHRESGGEHALALMLMLAGRHHEFVQNQLERRWEKPNWDEPFTLHGKSVCTVGTGTLGKSVAERTACLGMKVTGVNRSATPHELYQQVFPLDSLLQAIDDVQFVVLTVPLTKKTQGMIGRKELERMPDDAYLINISRGRVVDEEALLEALQSGRIRGAGLDVFYTEPLPEDSSFWTLENVVITPHCAGYFNKHYVAVSEIIKQNFRRLTTGEELINVVS
jgi:D-2-hydroxyacid dehydrogenase (NADP+)